MNDFENLDLKSMDIVEDKKEQLKQVFPEVFNENKIDFEKLKLVLGSEIEASKERYGMTWPGKSDCFKLIQSPSIATLKPARDESINFDTTENIFIEGENLEVLKLLQKSYYGKVKLIYIDPPYNTGNDLLYKDDYKDNLKNYLEYTGQVDSEGNKFSTNTDTEGRFHTNWLNMMYPRLYLSRNLLRNDGFIVVSIDDNEGHKLKMMMDEVFGEENFITEVIVQSNKRGQTYKQISKTHEYLLFYAKEQENEINELKKEGKNFDLNLSDNLGNFNIRELRNRNPKFNRSNRPNLFFPIYVNNNLKDKDGFYPIVLEKQKDFDIEILPLNKNGKESCWRWGKQLVIQNMNNNTQISNLVAHKKKDGSFGIYEKYRKTTFKAKSIWNETEVITEKGTVELGDIGLSEYFDFPKPLGLLKKIILLTTDETDLILDFFSGSATTACAVLELNEHYDENRQFIMIQLPELINNKKEVLKTIADVGKERIRRVIKKIKEEKQNKLNSDSNLDLGFKVFKLDKSNFNVWDGESVSKNKESIQKQLEMHIDHINPEATEDDILYEIILKAGFELTTKIELLNLNNKTVYSIDDGSMLICLDKNLNKEVIKEIADKVPGRVVFLDEGFKGNDELKTNAIQIMKSKGIEDFKTI
ncbi:MAG: site-specific DNA-methyltransferase [Candidatus Humimicrobiaceae bacterium]